MTANKTSSANEGRDMENYEQRVRRLELILNFVCGYLTALEAYAMTPEQRQSAAEVHNMIITSAATMPALERDEREQDG